MRWRIGTAARAPGVSLMLADARYERDRIDACERYRRHRKTGQGWCCRYGICPADLAEGEALQVFFPLRLGMDGRAGCGVAKPARCRKPGSRLHA